MTVCTIFHSNPAGFEAFHSTSQNVNPIVVLDEIVGIGRVIRKN